MTGSSTFEDYQDFVDRGETVSLAPILGLAHYAVGLGMDEERVESLIGVPLICDDPTERVSCWAGPILFNQILIDGLSTAPAIELAQTAPLSFLGGLERLVFLAPTGREALYALAANFSTFHDGLIAEFEETTSYSKFSFKYKGVEHDNGCCNEVLVSFLVRLMRSVFGARGQPHEVQLRYDRNGNASAYEDYFVSPVKFWSDDENFAIVFRKSDMDWAQSGHDPELFRLASKRFSKAAALRRDSSPATDYFELITASNTCVRAGIFGVAAVAAKAGFGERTAQRIAQRHGSSIGKLIDQARLRMLREQLSQSPHTCAEDLSALLGFSESRALRRAIKSWTGQSLSRFRTEHYRYNKFN